MSHTTSPLSHKKAADSSPPASAPAPGLHTTGAAGDASTPDVSPATFFPPDVPRKSPRRLICRNVSFVIGKKDGDLEMGIEAFPGHKITVNLGYTAQAELIEIGFSEVGKGGHGLQLLLAELGLKLSRVVQGRSPEDHSPVIA